MINANDQLREHNCSDNFYNYNFGLTISEGVLALAQKFECFWFIDIIASYQRDLRNEEFQVWKLTKHDGDKATVTCEDGNNHTLKFQKIGYTDFSADEATVWVEFGTAILPSEH